MIHMIPVDVGHDRKGGVKVFEGAVAFVQLGREEGVVPEAGVRPDVPNLGANVERRGQPRFLQDQADHGRRGRLSVRPRNANPSGLVEKPAQGLSAPDRPDASAPGGGELLTVPIHGAAEDHQLRVEPLEVLPGMSGRTRNPQSLQRLYARGFMPQVASADRVPHGREQPGKGTHSRPADPHEMNPFRPREFRHDIQNAPIS